MKWLEAINEMKLPPLVQGSHTGPEHGLCAMEMVAFMECLPHTDKPECTCNVISVFVIAVNDTLDDNERQKLLPILPELVDTVVDPKFMQERENYFRDVAMRDFEYSHRGRREMDYERDRFRGQAYVHHGSMAHQAHELAHQGPAGAVQLISQCYPPFHRADILIGVLRGALKIGKRKPKTEFKKPARVKELATVTYLPQQTKPQQAIAEAIAEMPPQFKIPHGMQLVKDNAKFFAIDCVA